ncbi:hypothetical protein [uncultured Enterovirga sp.]|uniref:hypothetical protein n=1 Tax=uncultured Enterovirga sp. TaxID=2026352 RepID=UPI0035C9F100
MPTEKQLAEAERLLREFDWSEIDKMSDDQIRAAWAWDKDTVWPTDVELAEFDLVIPAKSRRPPPKEAAE